MTPWRRMAIIAAGLAAVAGGVSGGVIAAGTSSTTTTTSSTSATTSPGGVCVSSANDGHCPFPAESYIIGANGNPYVDQNVWNASSTYHQTLYATSPDDWYVTANANTGWGGVQTFPNTGFNMTGTVDGYATTTSSWNVTIPTDNTQTAGWAAYDLWFNNWADEVMIQTDLTANSYYDCTAVAETTFGGMPWHLCVFGTERVWKPGTDDSHLINQAAGSVDVRAMLVWMEANGYLPAGSKWTAASFGFEICDTRGNTQSFAVKGFTWDATRDDGVHEAGDLAPTPGGGLLHHSLGMARDVLQRSAIRGF